MVQVEEHIPNEKLLLAQLEEQGECRNKAASRRHGEGVDEADKAWASPTAIAMKPVEDLEPPHMSSGQPRGEEEGIGVSWETRERTPRRRKVSLGTEGRHRVSPTAEDNTESVLHGQRKILKKPVWAYYSGTNWNPTHIPIAIDAMNLEEPPQISSDKSRGGGGTSCINARKDEEGATHLDRAKRDLRGLKWEGDISLVSEEEKDLLPDPGGVPQHRKVGYRPMVDRRPVPRTPRKGANAMWTTKAEEDEVATVGLQMWLHGLGIPF